MTTVRVSAPGKLFLLGEYAVLEGAPALLTAVDRRATVTATASASWRLTARELGIEALPLGQAGALPSDLDAATRSSLTLFDAVRTSVAAVVTTPRGRPLDLVIDTAALHRDGHKLGLGSSAAVATALTAALTSAGGLGLDRDALFAIASAAHHAAQDGSGSGGDIAAAVHGGLLLYTPGESPVSATWPSELALFAVMTGTGSSTVDLVARVAGYREREPLAYGRDLDALCALAAEAEEALADTDAFLALADEYFHALEALGAHADAGIVTERHQELRPLAAASGAVFKPTGAGGGDLGLVFAKLGATDALQSAFARAGAAVIPVPYSPDGVRIEAAA